MDRFDYGVGLDLTSAIAIQLLGDMLDEVGQSGFVVGGDEGAQPADLSWCARPSPYRRNGSRIGARDRRHPVFSSPGLGQDRLQVSRPEH